MSLQFETVKFHLISFSVGFVRTPSVEHHKNKICGQDQLSYLSKRIRQTDRQTDEKERSKLQSWNKIRFRRPRLTYHKDNTYMVKKGHRWKMDSTTIESSFAPHH